MKGNKIITIILFIISICIFTNNLYAINEYVIAPQVLFDMPIQCSSITICKNNDGYKISESYATFDGDDYKYSNISRIAFMKSLL